MKDKTRILVAQGYCLLRDAMAKQLEQQRWMEVCAVTSDFRNIREPILQNNPHVIIINVSSKCGTGMSSLRDLKREFPWVQLLAFSCDSEFEDICAGLAFRSGADGYVSSADNLKELVKAIWKISRGGCYISPQTTFSRQKTFREFDPVSSKLSRQEAEVFCLTGCGYVTKRIAEMMGLNVKTVESYRERIRGKMNLASGADLLYLSVSFMRSAARRDLIGMDDHEAVRDLLSATA